MDTYRNIHCYAYAVFRLAICHGKRLASLIDRYGNVTSYLMAMGSSTAALVFRRYRLGSGNSFNLLGADVIEIPDIYRKAWQEEIILVSAQYAVPRTTLCDALVWALAQLRKSEFKREHHLFTDGHHVVCDSCSYGDVHKPAPPDPRHDWTDAQWREVAIKKMEGGDETIRS